MYRFVNQDSMYAKLYAVTKLQFAQQIVKKNINLNNKLENI